VYAHHSQDLRRYVGVAQPIAEIRDSAGAQVFVTCLSAAARAE
jgi:hypothetical protein